MLFGTCLEVVATCPATIKQTSNASMSSIFSLYIALYHNGLETALRVATCTPSVHQSVYNFGLW